MRTRHLALALLAAVIAATPSADCQERREKPKPDTVRVETIGKWAYDRLARAQEALAKADYALALSKLDEMRQGSERLNSHERAMMWQTYGYLHSAQERYAQAAESFEKCLAEGGLPPQVVLDIRYNLAQVYLMREDYPRSIEHFRLWFEGAENPRPEAHFMFALAYLRAERPREALVQARQAVAKADPPQESWLQLLLSLHFELGQFAEALTVLEQLIERFPKKVYWLQLAAAHSELGDHRQALGVMELAYEQGYLTEHRELVNLAQLYLQQDIPYEAAVVLRRGIDAGTVEKNAASWKLLAESLLQARERDRAVEPLTRAAELSEDGGLYVRLAQLAIDVERWSAARGALEAALAKGNLDDPGSVYLLLGVANMSEGREAEARRAFASAQKFEKTTRTAAEWLARLDEGQLAGE